MLQCCPTSDGGACVILASEAFVKKHRLEAQAIQVASLRLVTDGSVAFKSKSSMELVGYGMSKKAASDAYKEAGIGARDIQVVELHDCFSANELITYEALGLCPEGKAGEFIDRGDNTFGGRVVVNPSGGLISKGHPLGATGLAQCSEITWQLRQWCGKRQVPNVRYGLQHNIGLGGAVVVGIYTKAYPSMPDAYSRIGYNPAVECRVLTLKAAPLANAKGSDISKAGSNKLESVPGFISSNIFQGIHSALQALSEEERKKMVSGTGALFQFDISKDGKTQAWCLDFKNGLGQVAIGTSPAADLIVSIGDDDFLALATGKMTGQKAFMQGKLKMKGKMALAMKLDPLFKQFQSKAKL